MKQILHCKKVDALKGFNIGSVILSKAKLQLSPESFRGEARLSISDRSC